MPESNDDVRNTKAMLKKQEASLQGLPSAVWGWFSLKDKRKEEEREERVERRKGKDGKLIKVECVEFQKFITTLNRKANTRPKKWMINFCWF